MGTGIKADPKTEGFVTCVNGYLRVQEIEVVNQDIFRGKVTDGYKDSKNGIGFQSIIYFRRAGQVLVRVNDQEMAFINEADVIFMVG